MSGSAATASAAELNEARAAAEAAAAEIETSKEKLAEVEEAKAQELAAVQARVDAVEEVKWCHARSFGGARRLLGYRFDFASDFPRRHDSRDARRQLPGAGVRGALHQCVVAHETCVANITRGRE